MQKELGQGGEAGGRQGKNLREDLILAVLGHMSLPGPITVAKR